MAITSYLPPLHLPQRQLPKLYANKEAALKKAGELIQEIIQQEQNALSRENTVKALLRLCFDESPHFTFSQSQSVQADLSLSDQITQSPTHETEGGPDTSDLWQELTTITDELKKNAGIWHVDMTRSAHLLALFVFITSEGERAFEYQENITKEYCVKNINKSLFETFCVDDCGIPSQKYKTVICSRYFKSLGYQISEEEITISLPHKSGMIIIDLNKQKEIRGYAQFVLQIDLVLENIISYSTPANIKILYLVCNGIYQTLTRIALQTKDSILKFKAEQPSIHRHFENRLEIRRHVNALEHPNRKKVFKDLFTHLNLIAEKWDIKDLKDKKSFNWLYRSCFDIQPEKYKKENAFFSVAMFIGVALLDEGYNLLMPNRGRYIIDKSMIRKILESLGLQFDKKQWEHVSHFWVTGKTLGQAFTMNLRPTERITFIINFSLMGGLTAILDVGMLSDAHYHRFQTDQGKRLLLSKALQH